MGNRVKWFLFLVLMFVVVLPVMTQIVALADGTIAAIPTLVVPPADHWWSGLLATVLAALATGITALLTWMSNNIKTWIQQKASQANTKESAAWYATALYLASIAVRYAYDKYGADKVNSADLRREASKFLKDRLIAIDKDIIAKNPSLDSLIDGLVAAAYTDLFSALSPLVPGLAPHQP